MKLFKFPIILLLLTIGYFLLLSYPYFFSKINRYDSLGPLSLVEEQSVNIQKTFSPERRTDQFDNHLLKGEKVSAKLRASENNFGILLLRFAQLSSNVTDTVVFRIKEEGKEDWYYENNYKANQFQPDRYFTFGFPPFKNSKNNTYVFEIESLSGTYKNGIGVSLREPQVALVYKYTRSDLININNMLPFIYKKITYVVNNVSFWENWQILASSLFSYAFFIVVKDRKIVVPKAIVFLLGFKKRMQFSLKKISRWFIRKKFYSHFFNTNSQKRVAVGLLLFVFALTYRYTSSLVNLDKLFYAGLGGQGDYDQFIRAATCALNFCSYAILGQNFLIETSILGVFYKIFGFTGALKAYLYLMLVLSSIVATLPHFLLSRRTWVSLGGILGSLFLATSDFLTHMALNFPPDNSSLFTFSMFFVVYLLTLNIGTIRWLLFFGLIGLVDGLNKALFLINDLAAFLLFIPVFLFEKTKRINKFPFVKLNSKLIFYSALPLLIFLVIYSAWEYFVQVKFSVPYWLRGLIQSRGVSYVSYTSFDDSPFTESIASQLLYLSASLVVMIKRLIDYADLRIIYLAPIFLGLLFFTFVKKKFPVGQFLLTIIFSVLTVTLLVLIKENYFNIHDIFPGEYIPFNWKTETYISIYLFFAIIFLFILNFKYSAIKLALPIIPYVVMLIILTKNSPFPRISTHVVAWSVILFAFIIDWIFLNLNKYLVRKRLLFGIVILILFISVYFFPKMVTMAAQLNSGFIASQNQVGYLRWVEGEIPKNAVILAGGKSDLVTLSENVKRPIIYNTLWSAAVLIRPKEIPGISPTDFSLVNELQNKDNFKKNKYVILEDDIYLWRARLTGVADNVFSTNLTTLHADDYSIKVYKYNSILNKAIYELNTR